jgi:CubicO group peptidase (beta-lactamase class C family)
MGAGLSRREFGKTAGIAGLGASGAVVLGGCSEKSVEARTAATGKTWKLSGERGAGLAGFDRAMKSFMQERDIECGQLAVARKGSLLLARGYTWTSSATLTTEPTSLFRIASLSKPVTAAAVLRLVQEGRLSLDARVTALLSLTPPSGRTMDPRLGNVTVRRLLQHTGGWDRDLSFDPTYRHDFAVASALGTRLPVTKANIMTYMNGQKLDHAPGSRYAYSNYGYMLLGRIIEQVSGTDYRTYVQNKILGPRGITRMRPGRTLQADAAPREVRYRSQYKASTVMDQSGTRVPAPYGAFNMEYRDASGGWLSTAVDLVRFAGIFDGANSVLNGTSIQRAFAKPETGVQSGGWWYGCGWSVRDVTGGRNTWHTGSLPGTYALLARRFDGVTYAALFNQRDDASGKSYSDIDPLLYRAANTVTSWPTFNRFGHYF